jgi:hypothetical protein
MPDAQKSQDKPGLMEKRNASKKRCAGLIGLVLGHGMTQDCNQDNESEKAAQNQIVLQHDSA